MFIYVYEINEYFSIRTIMYAPQKSAMWPLVNSGGGGDEFQVGYCSGSPKGDHAEGTLAQR